MMLGMVNSYAAARLRAKKPIKPRPDNSIAYISGSGTDSHRSQLPMVIDGISAKGSKTSRQVH